MAADGKGTALILELPWMIKCMTYVMWTAANSVHAHIVWEMTGKNKT